jgi:aspartate aminotransferase, mitochondrial
VDLALKFGYGDDCAALQEKRIQGVQALSGTGGLRIMGELLKVHGYSEIYVPNPTWGNHIPIFQKSGLEVRKYRYYDFASSSLDFSGLMEDMHKMPNKSAVLLHACAHNPTGMDPTMEQWQEISQICKDKQLLPFFDFAYQGFASGDAVKDAAALRMFVQEGHKLGSSPVEAARVVSQLKIVIRPMYSNPPRHGARIVSTILSDPQLTNDFLEQCAGMAHRIHDARLQLQTKLADAGSTRNWDHITRQIGMFAYSGLTKEQVIQLRDKHHMYCTLDGRISMAGVTSNNVDYIAQAIHDVSK